MRGMTIRPHFQALPGNVSEESLFFVLSVAGCGEGAGNETRCRTGGYTGFMT